MFDPFFAGRLEVRPESYAATEAEYAKQREPAWPIHQGCTWMHSAFPDQQSSLEHSRPNGHMAATLFKRHQNLL
jgi:hypothetical protein